MKLMYEYDDKKKFKKTWLKRSEPDQGRPVVNLVFRRDWIKDISKNKTYTKGN